MITAKDFGELIKRYRKHVHLTQDEVAAACGIGVRFVRELEKGKATCQLEKALLVAQMLGLKLKIILPEILHEPRRGSPAKALAKLRKESSY